MIGQTGSIIMGFMDTFMIGQHSTDELAASGFVNGFITLMLIAAMGFSYGLTPIVGSLLGNKHTKLIAGKLKNSLLANSMVALILVGLMLLLFVNLSHFGLPDNLISLIRPYLLILTISIFPQMAFNTFKQFSDGIQDTKTPMWILLSGNILNIIGNWMLIYGIGCFPELGIVGAGLATLISRVYMWLAFSFVFHITSRYKTYRLDFSKSHIDKSTMLQLNRLGWPVMLQLGMETASFSLSTIYIGWLGTTALAAHQVMVSIAQLCYMLYYGMSAAVAVQVSYFRGAGKIAETKRCAMAGLHLNWMLGLITALPIFVLRHEIGSWFSSNEDVVQLVSIVILPFCLYQIGDALQCTYSNALRGMENVSAMIWIAFIAYFVISLPLGYVFGIWMNGGLTGIWMAFPFGLTSAGIMYYFKFQQNGNYCKNQNRL